VNTTVYLAGPISGCSYDGCTEWRTFAKERLAEGFPVELADVIIRVLDLCGKFGIDLRAAVAMKMAYNESRPYRHGGRTC
jgi:NTP pyrophosphatase (non-canonical NTP hydrolase)